MKRNKYDSTILQRAYNEGYDHGSESLRDHFAGLAMQAIMSKIRLISEKGTYGEQASVEEILTRNENIAYSSYKMADQMMEARND